MIMENKRTIRDNLNQVNMRATGKARRKIKLRGWENIHHVGLLLEYNFLEINVTLSGQCN